MSEYVLGPSYARNPHARFYTKTRSGTGSGYERWRSREYRDETPTQGSEDVYVAHHRLLAVAWCYPDSMSVGEILEHLEGRDVHHTLGVEWANIGSSPNFESPGLVVRGHGRHSEITQAEMRAWAEDDKNKARDPTGTANGDETCGSCGSVCETPARSADWEGVRCLSCSKVDSKGSPIEVSG